MMVGPPVDPATAVPEGFHVTTIDTPLATIHPTERRGALVDRISTGTPYAIAFGGQGAPWLEPLADLIRDFALEAELETLVAQAEERLAPVAAELARVGVTFTPLAWADVIAVGESAEDDDAPELPSSAVLDTPGASVPGILLTQLAGLRAVPEELRVAVHHRTYDVGGHGAFSSVFSRGMNFSTRNNIVATFSLRPSGWSTYQVLREVTK